jgi:hypothetical protein
MLDSKDTIFTILGYICFPEFIFRKITFQTFLFSGQRKI